MLTTNSYFNYIQSQISSIVKVHQSSKTHKNEVI